MMATLYIKKWSNDKAWVSEGSWSLKAYSQRIQACTNLQGTELKRIAKSIMNRELSVLDNVNMEKAEAIRHTLESSGAEVEIK